ncbi:MAG: hypothetical protein HUU50_15890 [Candidatus Brocadiae bacterium]|nr:hypothetical protein [Candidatus Brocadiia bacterium]
MKQAKALLFLGMLFFVFFIPIQANLLWLKNHVLLHGEILEYQEQKVIFKRWDNQGIIEIPWNALHSLSLDEIQKKLGIAIEKPSQDNIPAVQVYLRNGGMVLGIVHEEKPTYLMLKNKTGNIPIPISNILKKQEILVPMTEVYKPEELYLKLCQSYDLKTGKGNLELAKVLVRMENQGKAKIHFEKAKSLQPELSEQIQTLLFDMEKKASQNKQQKSIQLYYIYRNANRYKKALETLEELKASLEESEWKKFWEETLQHQKEYFQKEIVNLWMQKVSQKTGKIASDKKILLQESRQYVLISMPKEILSELSQELEISEQEIQSYLETRPKNNLYSFGYRSGSFIVGLEGREPEESSAKKPGSLKKIKNYGGLSEEWWQRAGISLKKEWLQACYYEQTFIVVRQDLKACSECSGKGTGIVSGETYPCLSCKGIQYERVVTVK